MDEQPLVCTIGPTTSSARMFPPDGICEYIFFDSVDKGNRNPLAFPTEWDTDLRTFMNAPQRYRTTAFGVGFGFDNAFTVFRHLRTTSTSPLQLFWSNRVFRFGILDTATVNTSVADVELALLVLKLLDSKGEVQRKWGNPSFIFSAGLVPDDVWLRFYEDKFTKLYKPDLFIAQGHYYYGDNTFRNSRVMPPTLLSRPSGIEETYQHDLEHATLTAERVAQNLTAGTLNRFSRLELPIILALSVTMKGRWTMVVPSQQFEDFFSACLQNTTAASFGSYSEVCRTASFLQTVYSRAVDSVLAVHDAEPVLFAYDNELGHCRKAQRMPLRFGIAVYDTDYEDFMSSCGPINKYGASSRLHTIRDIVNFYRTRFKSFSYLRPCQQLIS